MENSSNQLTQFFKGEVTTDKLGTYRTDYKIQYNIGSGIYWQNHEGTKLVYLDTGRENGKKILTFKLYDNQFCELYPP